MLRFDDIDDPSLADLVFEQWLSRTDLEHFMAVREQGTRLLGAVVQD